MEYSSISHILLRKFAHSHTRVSFSNCLAIGAFDIRISLLSFLQNRNDDITFLNSDFIAFP